MKLALKLDQETKLINNDIKGSLRSYVSAGKRLLAVKESNIFMPEYDNFTQYCDGAIIWGHTHCYDAINIYKEFGPVLETYPELYEAGQTKVKRLYKFARGKDEETKKELLHMAANTTAKGFDANIANMEGKVAHDECKHDGELEPFNRCKICEKWIKV